MTIADRIRRARAYAADRREWRDVDSLPALARLTAEYVTQARLSYPDHGHATHPGPDRETAEIADDLARLCAAGLPTHGSQPGTWICDPAQLWDAQAYAQRAAVECFAAPELADYVARRAIDAGLFARATLVADLPRRQRRDDDRLVPVSVYTHNQVVDEPASVDVLGPNEGVIWDVQTVFGGITRGGVSDLLAAISADGADAVERSAYLTVVDPRWGRQRHLWDTLDTTLAAARLAGAR